MFEYQDPQPSLYGDVLSVLQCLNENESEPIRIWHFLFAVFRGAQFLIIFRSKILQIIRAVPMFQSLFDAVARS